MDLSEYTREELELAYMGFDDPELAVLPLAKKIREALEII